MGVLECYIETLIVTGFGDAKVPLSAADAGCNQLYIDHIVRVSNPSRAHPYEKQNENIDFSS